MDQPTISTTLQKPKSVYIKALSKFAKKKMLKHLKMPMQRKRKIADRYALAIAAHHLKGGISPKTPDSDMGAIMSYVRNELKLQGH